MDKLEENVFKEFDGIVQDMVNELEAADKENRGIELKEFIKNLSKRYQQLNTHFRDAKIRVKEGKKKGFF